MIWISFNKWIFASNILFRADRIYLGKRWTPFCRISFAYKQWNYRLRNNVFKDSLRWCVVPDIDIKFHLFRKCKFKNIEDIKTHIQGCMFP
jgi:hypothetical protein